MGVGTPRAGAAKERRLIPSGKDALRSPSSVSQGRLGVSYEHEGARVFLSREEGGRLSHAAARGNPGDVMLRETSRTPEDRY